MRDAPSSFGPDVVAPAPTRAEGDVSTQVDFTCQRCGACCRQDGYVRLTSEDIDALAAEKGMSVSDFTAAFTRVTRDRAALALLDQPDGACIFLTNAGCAVEASKPRQCREFPETWRYKHTAAVCPAVRELEES